MALLKASASKVSGLLPPALRRSLAGAWLDLRSLPERIGDRRRWGEPLQALHNVGGGDFDRMGRVLLSQLREYAALSPDSPVLDIGCGTGRLAMPLAEFLAPNTAYTGFDISAGAIRTCQGRIGRAHPNFTFLQADIQNREYNPGGAIAEEAYGFPLDTATVEVVAAFSVFSHMTLPSIRRYLAEAARVLRPGGRFAFTAYVLTPERVAAIGQGEGARPFLPWRDGSMVVDLRSPERAIAHPLAGFEAAIAAAGLRCPDGYRPGQWLGPAAYEGGQDLFVVVKD
jgi:SAM-dependent methyltransferase